MTKLVIDTSVVIKWVVQEAGSVQALALRTGHRLIAPDLLCAEYANVLWKKVRRGELTAEEADAAARLFDVSDVDLMPMRPLLHDAMSLAVKLQHPAYDCFFVALARAQGCAYVTADARLVARVRQHPGVVVPSVVVGLAEI